MRLGIQIPRGMPVHVDGAPQLQCVWDGDWAVPVAARFENWTPPRERMNWHWWAVVGIGLVAALFACRIIMKRRMNH